MRLNFRYGAKADTAIQSHVEPRWHAAKAFIVLAARVSAAA